ncbi:G-type lectin S-receptor-like serine/threonine-protein kinase At1g34300 [Ananas comosus]|uniref:G-type lectin S-receptor-like serine/threonine-protein kinase At1g34300 n=1 Tax=Ananas comosus TaxID=4615 RepID=A0A6P5G0M2_ANACO|nr:G-type lectin S-receptor-like serine/threonine-protein kinase At1g34300 [Ananas comosus]
MTFLTNMTQHTAATVFTVVFLVIFGTTILSVAIRLIIYAKKVYLRRNEHTTITTNPSTPTNRAVANETLDTNSVEKLLEEVAPLQFSPEQLTGFTTNYVTKLGSGGFGAVYKGWLPNKVKIAVKVLRGDNLDERIKEQFMAEVGTIGRTHHINLVRLYGFCFEQELKALVFEYMKNGSLDRYLFDHEKHRTNVAALHEIAVGTAKGIKYLHEECENRIIHYDIKPENILLDANFTPKVADFGLARLLSRANTHITMTGMRGTPGYAAPEMWVPGAPITYKCDVYSFGIMLFEIVRRRRNFDERATESQQWFPTEALKRFVEGRLGEVMASLHGVQEWESMEKAERMCKVGLLCVQYRPQARPEMSMVVKMLEGEMEVTAPPTNAFQHFMGVEIEGRSSSTNPVTSGSSTR